MKIPKVGSIIPESKEWPARRYPAIVVNITATVIFTLLSSNRSFRISFIVLFPDPLPASGQRREQVI